MIGTGHHVAEQSAPLASPRTRGNHRPAAWMAAVTLACLGVWGCTSRGQRKDYELVSFAPVTTVAVAPALNFSGSLNFDPVRVADFMASELSTVPGIGVIGVNRVLAVLAEQKLTQIQSPEHAVEVCQRLGADRIIVFAITEFDPYTPVVGIAAQVYGRKSASASLDAVAASRAARPFPVSRGQANQLLAQVQRTFNGVHESVQHELRDYAAGRGEQDSPYRWRRYLVSQELYFRFCAFAIARELMQQQAESQTARGVAGCGEADPCM